MKAVLVEENYKGYYKRYALTLSEFELTFYRCLMDDMYKPSETAETYTLRPGVHLWYMLTSVNSDDWNIFFTDMAWGLPESDIDNDNLATIDKDNFDKKLVEFIKGLNYEDNFS